MDSTNQPIRHQGKTRILTHKEKTAIVTWVALYEPPSSVVQMVREKFGKEITEECVYYYRGHKNWQPLIQKLRSQWEAGILEIPMASKRMRVKRLNDIHERLYNAGKLEQASDILKEIRQEVEGKDASGKPNIFITQFNELSNEEIKERKLKIIQELERLRSTKMLGVLPIEVTPETES